ncbi:unnamed protein product [Vicia faba]|uniref:Uncharacterized protein n=1 Tax=Vicia faba TaxID=3906 RepID=A0AAV1B8D8_VICFA|nr:unnamed protein product [Vicia faba]
MEARFKDTRLKVVEFYFVKGYGEGYDRFVNLRIVAGYWRGFGQSLLRGSKDDFGQEDAETSWLFWGCFMQDLRAVIWTGYGQHRIRFGSRFQLAHAGSLLRLSFLPAIAQEKREQLILKQGIRRKQPICLLAFSYVPVSILA